MPAADNAQQPDATRWEAIRQGATRARAQPRPARPHHHVVHDGSELVISVPDRSLILLVGPAGAGKSTFASRHFTATEILSSDAFRAMVSDDEADQRASADAFRLLEAVAGYRLARGRLTVVDATNLRRADRRALLEIARAARRPAVAIVLALPEDLVQERNAQRRSRTVDPAVVRRHADHLRGILEHPDRLLGEGFDAVHVIDDPVALDAVRILRTAPPPRRARAAVRRADRTG